MEAIKSGDHVSILTSSGKRLEGKLHQEFGGPVGVCLQGRVLDLKGAYKQLAAHRADAPLNVIGVMDPTFNEIRLFEAVALMFGASAVVYAFLRFSRALAALALGLFGLVSVSLFDDHTQIVVGQLCDSALHLSCASLAFSGGVFLLERSGFHLLQRSWASVCFLISQVSFLGISRWIKSWAEFRKFRSWSVAQLLAASWSSRQHSPSVASFRRRANPWQGTDATMPLAVSTGV